MRILVTGATGQVGRELQEIGISKNFIFMSKEQLDITDKDALQRVFNLKIDGVINCAAYTAVDRAEDEKELAQAVNVVGVENLAHLCLEYKVPLIHISTDYVFDGKNFIPYKESDFTNPINVYGKTKLAGEKVFQTSGAQGIILRTSWVYSVYGNNFVKTMLRLRKREPLRVVWDQIGTPTYAKDIAQLLLFLIENHFDRIKSYRGEIFHYSNEGVASWYDFAKAIFEKVGETIEVQPIRTIEYSTAAQRPYYTLLDKSKIKKTFGIVIPHWRESLKSCLMRMINE